ncbi:MAG: glycosyltransferase family 2 protein [Taibaiella sp.]|nr:glycosyltransferase family 2 protein [Taibaiella sp.]
MQQPKIIVIIPAYNEEKSIGKVVADIPKAYISEIVVVNNNSKDGTRAQAQSAGATVIDQPKQGYGNACLKGMEYVTLNNLNPDIIVFMDGDYSDYPEQIPLLIKPILEDGIDMVIGSRALGNRQRGSMTMPQIFGNWLATRLIRTFYGVKYTDLGPFRAIKWKVLQDIGMVDRNYGWTVEMQLKVAKKKYRIKEVPVNYRVRIGFSKVSGTVKGTIMAGYKIITTIFKYM